MGFNKNLYHKESKVMLQTSEDERELGWGNLTNISLFHSPVLQQQAAAVSPRLNSLYAHLSDLYQTDPQRNNDQHFSSKASQLFTTLNYQPAPFEGPICNRDTEPKSMFCFDCNQHKLDNIHIYCAECFIEEQHRGHYYTVEVGQKGLCDCGSDFVRPESCCPKHRNKKVVVPFDREAQTYQKEVQFLIYFLLRVKREKSNEAFKYGVVWQNLLKKIVEVTSKSYLYQSKTSEIYIKPLSESFKYETRPIIEIVFNEKWSNSTLLLFNQIHLQLYPIKIARKKILMELLKVFSSPFESYQTLETLSKVFFQYTPMEQTILKLLSKNIVKPIACYQTREDYLDCLNVHILVYYWYERLSKNPRFPEILKTVLEKTQIRYFFNIPPCRLPSNEQTKKQKNMFQQFYIKHLLVFGQTLAKMENCRDILTKLIRECYHTIVEAEEDTLFCAERTLGVLLLIYFNYDFRNFLKCTLQELKELFNIKRDLAEEDYFNKLMNLLLLFIVSMVQDFFDIVPQSTGISINYCYALFFTLFTFKVQQQRKGSPNVLQRMIDAMKEKVKRETEHCYKLVTVSEEEFQQNSFLNQIELNSNAEAICKEGIKVILFIYGVLTALETRVPEVIVGNLLGRPDANYIKQYYRELALLAPGKTIKEFKETGEAWINNEQLLEDFILGDYEGIKNNRGTNKEHYFSGISFYSEYTGNQLNEQNSLRLKMKINSEGNPQNSYEQVIAYIFDKPTCLQFLDFYGQLIMIMASKWLTNSNNARQHLRISTSLLVDLFADRKLPELKAFLVTLKGRVESDAEFGERLKAILLILEEKVEGEGGSKSPENHPEEPASTKNLKKLQIMKELKEKQNKFLSQTTPPLTDPEEDTCIICREARQDEPLQYLCRLKFSNALTYTVLEMVEPLLMITTCGHKIHEKCLAENIQGDNQFGAKYQCFLCKRSSNLRLPLVTSSTGLGALKKIIEELLTVVTLQFENNQLLGVMIPAENISLNRFFFYSLAYQLYLYRPCFERLFRHYMLPIYDLILNYLVITQKEPELSSNYRNMTQNNPHQQLAPIFDLLIPIIDGHIHPKDSYFDYLAGAVEEKRLTRPVEQRIEALKRRTVGEEGRFDLNLFAVPQELYQLSVSARKCSHCQGLWSKLRACLYCGYKTCEQCEFQMFKHRTDFHLGTHIVIELFNGCLTYETIRGPSKVVLTVDHLYKNYAGEELSLKFRGEVVRDKYRLDGRCWQKTVEDILLSNVDEMVDEKLANRQQCVVQ